jgi:hypothetical protein
MLYKFKAHGIFLLVLGLIKYLMTTFIAGNQADYKKP